MSDNGNNVSVIPPDQLMELCVNKLTIYEQKEILSYKEVYFVGEDAEKIAADIVGGGLRNYDDKHGSYLHVKNDHIAYRYEILKAIGQGAFGTVLKVFDHKSKQNVALKIIKNREELKRQTKREIRILEHLRRIRKPSSENIIQMIENFEFRGHRCITFPLMVINLSEFLKKNKVLDDKLVKKFCQSLLLCLDLLTKNKIIHSDIKPENIMLELKGSDFDIKVIDFGGSFYEHNKLVYNPYIQTRWYRAPEVILGAKIGMPIDMWSLGCILCELLTGYPLFMGEEDEGDQLSCIIELLGMPPQRLINQSKQARTFISSKGYPRYCTVTTLPDGKTVLNGGRSRQGKYRGPPGSKKLQTVLKTENKPFLDFISRCLTWEPEARMNPGTALIHPWISPPSPAKMCTW